MRDERVCTAQTRQHRGSFRSANRGPDVFEDLDCLDVGRGQGAHLSLGRGIHHSQGGALARLEGRLVVQMLLKRFSQMDLYAECWMFRKGLVVRGLQSLPVRCVRA